MNIPDLPGFMRFFGYVIPWFCEKDIVLLQLGQLINLQSFLDYLVVSFQSNLLPTYNDLTPKMGN